MIITILISEGTNRLARDFFKLKSLGKVEVKGKEETQEAFELIKATEVETRIAAAVVKAPLGSANTETSKGGTMDSRADSSISMANTISRPPINSPVRFTAFGPLEKMASWTRLSTSSDSTLV